MSDFSTRAMRALERIADQQKIYTDNLSRADIPNQKEIKPSFSRALSSASSSSSSRLASTDSQHISSKRHLAKADSRSHKGEKYNLTHNNIDPHEQLRLFNESATHYENVLASYQKVNGYYKIFTEK